MKTEFIKIIALIGLLMALVIFVKPAKAEIIVVSGYDVCMQSCLNTYANVDMYNVCVQYCQVNAYPPEIVIVPPYYHGHDHDRGDRDNHRRGR